MILVINAGSSSLKINLYQPDLTVLADGMISNIGTDGTLTLNGQKHPVTTADHDDALARMLAALADAGYPAEGFTAAAHRVVHGGTQLTAPTRVTPQVVLDIRACIPLAPLHNPVNLTGILSLGTALPNLPQYASFDTAFHATVTELEHRYAIPARFHDDGIRRYGFHGLSYANMVTKFGEALPDRLLALHLGNGASLCAILRGTSVATSMGYSPLSGLTMGTRAGDIDGAAVLRIADEIGAAETDHLLNKESGLKALAGDNNMKILLDRQDDDARFAVDHFCYWAARHAGSAIVAMGGLDAVAFTGGIGENAAPVRDRIMEHLACFGEVPVHVVPADEEKQIARDAVALMMERG
ncbi:acetate/propionate family kinase [Loktanella agnita]|uniref:acetate/propionate family kinase n=1 Tax=Loktanella agnita TaxID=287097 RepID=UPI0039878E87